MGRSYIKRNEWNPEELVKAYNTLSLVHGDGDQLVKIDGSRYLHENSPSNDKTFKVHEWAALLTALSKLIASLWVFLTSS